MSKVIIDNQTTQFASCRIYLIDCTYNNAIWQNDPSELISQIRNQCDRITNFSYKTIKVHNIRQAIGTSMEIHIGDVTYNTKDRLSSTEIDTIRINLSNSLKNILTFSFARMDVVLDMFLEQPSPNFIFNSMSQVI